MLFQQEDNVRWLCRIKMVLLVCKLSFSVNTVMYFEVECLTVCVFFKDKIENSFFVCVCVSPQVIRRFDIHPGNQHAFSIMNKKFTLDVPHTQREWEKETIGLLKTLQRFLIADEDNRLIPFANKCCRLTAKDNMLIIFGKTYLDYWIYRDWRSICLSVCMYMCAF